MAKGSSRQEGQDALSERMRAWFIRMGESNTFGAHTFTREVAQLEAENDSLRQLHTAQMEENERLREDYIELFEYMSNFEPFKTWKKENDALKEGSEVAYVPVICAVCGKRCWQIAVDSSWRGRSASINACTDCSPGEYVIEVDDAD